MKPQDRQFLERIAQQHQETNRILQQKELQLRTRLEAMQGIMGDHGQLLFQKDLPNTSMIATSYSMTRHGPNAPHPSAMRHKNRADMEGGIPVDSGESSFSTDRIRFEIPSDVHLGGAISHSNISPSMIVHCPDSRYPSAASSRLYHLNREYSEETVTKEENSITGGFLNCLKSLIPTLANKFHPPQKQPPTGTPINDGQEPVDQHLKALLPENPIGEYRSRHNIVPNNSSRNRENSIKSVTIINRADNLNQTSPKGVPGYPHSNNQNYCEGQMDTSGVGSLNVHPTYQNLPSCSRKSILKHDEFLSKNLSATCASSAKTSKPVRTSPPTSFSCLSLDSADFHNLENICQLVKDQNILTEEVKKLEEQDQLYQYALKDFEGFDLGAPQVEFPVVGKPPCCCMTSTDLASDLKLENGLLKNELRNMRQDIKQYIEKMEGPMMFKIESQQYKSQLLEEKLENAAKELAKTHDLYQKEISNLNDELFMTRNDFHELTEINEKLTQECSSLQARCAQLDSELVRQKLLEAEIVMKLNEELKMAQQGCRKSLM